MKDNDSILREVSGLLSLAQSPNENEARNAAKKACDLISKHDLAVMRREDVETASGMLAAYQGCVMIAKEEYDRLLGEISRFTEGKRRAISPPEEDRGTSTVRRRGKLGRQVEGTIAEAAGDIVSSVVRGAIRRL